jgi:hypothetical protein
MLDADDFTSPELESEPESELGPELELRLEFEDVVALPVPELELLLGSVT